MFYYCVGVRGYVGGKTYRIGRAVPTTKKILP